MTLTIPPEGPYSDVELDWIENEPPGLFPEGQDSLWGQMRKVFCDYLQENIVDVLADMWLNLDPRLARSEWLDLFEKMLGLPSSAASKSLEARRGFVLSRLKRGAFTRTRRREVIEAFILATFGESTAFDPTGIPLDAGGIAMLSGEFDLAGTYEVIENITDFSYAVHINDSIAIDVDGLTRELDRITPDGISFTITILSMP